MSGANKTSQTGMSLVEVLIAVVIALMVGVAAVSVLRVRSASLEDNAAFQEAQTRAEEALSSLTTVAEDLPEGGSFTLAGTTVTNTACTDQTCDAIFSADLPEDRTSLAKGVPYSSIAEIGTIVTGRKGDLIFFRRWRVDNLDADYKLRKITIGIFTEERAYEPLVLQSTVVGIK